MTLALIEGAIDAVKGYLETNIVAKLDILDAEYGDFALDDIKGWYIAEQPSIPEYPSVFVLGDTTAIIGEGAGWMQASHTLSIICFVGDQDTAQLRRKLYRYIRAMIELLIRARTVLGYVITFDRVDFTPMYGREGTFLSDARLIASFSKYENT